MSRRGNTRQRILETSLRMFNAEGEPNVSTNHIADEMDISPGNLYYHFNNKEEIVTELYDRLEREITDQLVTPASGDAPTLDDIWLTLHLRFETIGTYRFFFRDLVNITTRYGTLDRRFRRLLRRQRESLQAICAALVHAKVLQAGERDIAALCDNLLLIMTYWFNFALLSGREPDPGEAVYQQLGLLAPYLAAQPRSEWMTLAAGYR